MAIFVDAESKILVQGITGREGRFCAVHMASGGTNVVAGVSPGKGGQTIQLSDADDGRPAPWVPVFDSVAAAVEATGADVSVIFVPARFAQDAMLEAADANVGVIVCMTEGIPVSETVEAVAQIERRGLALVGPNCPGLASPPAANVGMMPNGIFTPGPVGLVSRSGTLTMQVVEQLTEAGIGQTTCVGIGGDPVHGVGFIDCLERFEADPDTRVIALIGEIGGSDEERAADYVSRSVTKPVVAYVAGFSAPPGRQMGHAGAIVSGSAGTAAAKAEALEAVGIPVARDLDQIVTLLRDRL